MPIPAFQIRRLSGRLDEAALLDRRLRLVIYTGILQGSEQGLRSVIPADAPVGLERITPAGLVLRVNLKLFSALAEVRLFVGTQGRLGLDLVAVRTELLPIPTSLATAALREFLPAQPWLHPQPGTGWEVDLAGLVRPFGVDLPPLQAVRPGAGMLELEFARAPSEPEPAPRRMPPEPAKVGAAKEPAVPAAPEPAPGAGPLRERIEAMFPSGLQVSEPPAPGQAPVRLSFRIANPGADLLHVRIGARPFWIQVSPDTVALGPGQSETVTVEVDPGKVTRENYQEPKLILTWAAMETVAGAESTCRGEVTVPIQVPPPRRLFLCPNPACGQIVYGGDPVCKHCGLPLRYCPVCEAPALRAAAVCSGPEKHPLPQE